MNQPVSVRWGEYKDPKDQFKCIGSLDLDKRPQFFRVESREAFKGLVEFNYSVSNSNLTFYKRLWKQTGGFSEKIKAHTDWEFMARAVRQTDLAVVNEVILEYRLLADSLNRRNLELSARECKVLNQNLENEILGHPEYHEDLFWTHYWRIRGDAWRALKRGRVGPALARYWQLLRSGAISRHILKRTQNASA